GSLRDAPDVTFATFPVRIARVDRAVAGDGGVVWLVHLVEGKPEGVLDRSLRDREDVVLLVVGDEHGAVAREADDIADAALGQSRERLGRRAADRQLADGAGFAEIDDEEIAVEIGGRPFD